MVIIKTENLKVKNRDVWNKTDGRCWYCGERLIKADPAQHGIDHKRRWYTIDHATPRSRGGSSEIENLLPCCNYCNGKKGDMTVEEYRATRSLDYQFWAEREKE